MVVYTKLFPPTKIEEAEGGWGGGVYNIKISLNNTKN